MSQPTPEQQARFERGLSLLPPRFRKLADLLLDTWIARMLLGTAWSLQRIEIFDRSMAIAAQLFTSVFPVLILAAAWVGNADTILTDTLSMPPAAEATVGDAVKNSASATFGLLGTIIVLASATSLSRALARAFSSIWILPRPRNSLGSAWRWIAVVLALVLLLVLVRRAAEITADLPPPSMWMLVLMFLLYTSVAVFVPWVLLKGVLSARALLVGAVLFAVTMLTFRPISEVWLTHSLGASASRYGTIGVAFTYLAWLYVISWVFLVSAVLGQVLVTDQGKIGRVLAGPKPLVRMERADQMERVLVDEQP